MNHLLVPNVALDLGVGALRLTGLSVDAAAAIFLVLSFAIFVGGFCRLAQAFGAMDATKPLLASLLFFCGPLMHGLVNYVLGIGLAFWMIAAWMRAPPPRRVLLAILGTVFLFYVHLLGAAVFVAVIGCLELPLMISAIRKRGAGWATAVSSVAAFVLFLTLVVTSPTIDDSMPARDGSNLWFIGHQSLSAMALWKASIFRDTLIDGTRLWAAALTLAGGAVFVLLAASAGRGRVAWPAMLAIGLFVVAVLALPDSAGPGSMLDYRLGVLPFLLAAAAVRTIWRSPLWRVAAVGTLLTVSFGRSVEFAVTFRSDDAVYRAFDAAVADIPSGSVLMVAKGSADVDISRAEWWAPPMEHVATRAALRGVFVPTVFATASQQPVVLKAAYIPWRRTWETATQAGWTTMLEDVRPICESAAQGWGAKVFLVVVYPGSFVDSVIAPATLVASTPRFRLVDICRAESHPV